MSDDEAPDLFLREWCARKGKRQASLVTELGFDKNSAFLIWHGRQPYSRKLVNRLAAWLEIEPFELLLPPERALTRRELEQSAYRIAAETAREFKGQSRTAEPVD